MQNAYHHSDYAKASLDLFCLSNFLLGFGEGIKDFPEPPKPKVLIQSDVRARMGEGGRHQSDCKAYYEKHCPVIMQAFGQYQQRVLKALENTKFSLMESTTIDA